MVVQLCVTSKTLEILSVERSHGSVEEKDRYVTQGHSLVVNIDSRWAVGLNGRKSLFHS